MIDRMMKVLLEKNTRYRGNGTNTYKGETKMANYHVKACEGGIVAGITKKNGEFSEKSNIVTDEAIAAVRDWLLYTMPEGANHRELQWGGNGGVVISLEVSVSRGESTEG